MTLQMSTENSKQDSKKKRCQLYDVNDVTLFLIVHYSSIEGR